MKSNKTVETNLYKSLNTSFSIKKIENGQTFKLSDLSSVSQIKGLEHVSPELETIAKLKDKEASKAAQASNLGGAEVDGFSKTLSSLDISIQTSDFIIVFVLALVLVVLVMALASSNLLRKQPKELLLDSE